MLEVNLPLTGDKESHLIWQRFIFGLLTTEHTLQNFYGHINSQKASDPKAISTFQDPSSEGGLNIINTETIKLLNSNYYVIKVLIAQLHSHEI